MTSTKGLHLLVPESGCVSIYFFVEMQMYLLNVILFLGLRLLSANTDMTEAESLSHSNDIIDIYSNSWGSATEGKDIYRPERMTQMTFRNGVIQVSIKSILITLHYYVIFLSLTKTHYNYIFAQRRSNYRAL